MEQYFLGFLLLTGHPDATPSITAAEAACVKAAAVAVQVMDRNERNIYFAEEGHYQGDLRILRGRYLKYRDCPLVEQADALPPADHSAEAVARNAQFRRWLEGNEVFYRSTGQGPVYDQTKRENAELGQFWAAVREARCDYYYVIVRRDALRVLRDRFDFIPGRDELPPSTPHWRLPEGK